MYMFPPRVPSNKRPAIQHARPVLLKSKISTVREQFLRNETVDWRDWLLETLPIEAGSKFFNFCVFTSVELPQIHSDAESKKRKLFHRTLTASSVKIKM